MQTCFRSLALIIVLNSTIAVSQDAAPTPEDLNTRIRRLNEHFDKASKPSEEDYGIDTQKRWICKVATPRTNAISTFKAQFGRDDFGEVVMSISDSPAGIEVLNDKHPLVTGGKYSDYIVKETEPETASTTLSREVRAGIHQFTVDEWVKKRFGICIRKDEKKLRMEVNALQFYVRGPEKTTASSEVGLVRKIFESWQDSNLSVKVSEFEKNNPDSLCFDSFLWKQMAQAVCESE